MEARVRSGVVGEWMWFMRRVLIVVGVKGCGLVTHR